MLSYSGSTQIFSKLIDIGELSFVSLRVSPWFGVRVCYPPSSGCEDNIARQNTPLGQHDSCGPCSPSALPEFLLTKIYVFVFCVILRVQRKCSKSFSQINDICKAKKTVITQQSYTNILCFLKVKSKVVVPCQQTTKPEEESCARTAKCSGTQRYCYL